MSNWKINVDHVSKKFIDNQSPEGLVVLTDISFSVKERELFCVLGPSGCGKTTLLNIISGLDFPTKGKIFFNSEKSLKKSNIGIVFQRDLQYPWRTAWKNILIGLEVQDKLNKDVLDKAKKYWKEYKLDGFEKFYPKSLSGGMRQKISLIRTLVCEPDILLLDEPFSNIDYETKLELEEDVLRIVKDKHKTIVFVTHDIEEAISIADKVLVLSHLPTKIVSEYEINLTVRERNPVSARKAPEFKEYFLKIWEDMKHNR